MFKKLRNPNEGSRYQKYNSLKQQLQRQNAALLKERQNIVSKINEQYQIPSQYTILQNNDEDQYEEQIQVNKGYLNSNYNPQDPPSFEPHHRYKSSRRHSPHKSNQKMKKYQQMVISDDVIQIIQDIQRKACNQIESLRDDKIQLMRKLNQQIKIHNAEKKRRIKLQNKLHTFASQRSKNDINNSSRVPMAFEQEQYQQKRPISQSHEPKFGKKYNIHQKPNISQRSNKQQIQQPQYQERIQQNQQYDDKPYPRPNYESQQNINQNSGQEIRRPQNINANIPQSQSMYYVDNRQQPRVPYKGPQNEVQDQINRLRQQNMHMKSNLNRNNFQNALSIKNRLQNQLRDLSAKANYYEQMIRQNTAINPRIQTSQIENLIAQSNFIADEGRKLLKAKSNPDFRSATQLLNLSGPYKNNQNSRYRLSKPLIEEEQGYNAFNNERKRKGGNKFGSNLSGEYQMLIQSMNAAAYS